MFLQENNKKKNITLISGICISLKRAENRLCEIYEVEARQFFVWL